MWKEYAKEREKKEYANSKLVVKKEKTNRNIRVAINKEIRY